MTPPSIAPPPEVLVVLLPGIGGSELATPAGERVWWAGRRALVDLFVRSDRMARDDLKPVGLITTKTLTPFGGCIPGYEKLLDALGDRLAPGRPVDDGDPQNVRLDARVVAFPYDFRRSIVDAAQCLDREVDRRLEALGWRGLPDTVVLIGHSMGGLVARQWVAQGNWERCRAVVTLGTPYNGAPKALDCLVNGLVPWWLPFPDRARDLIREWPGVHELAPQYRAVEDLVAPRGTGPGAHPVDLRLPGVDRRLGEAARVHTHMNEEWARNMSQTACHALRGRWHPTLLHATWDGTSLRSSKQPPSWILGDGRNEAGDGTVPTISATPDERRRDLGAPQLVDRHGPMVTAAQCIDDVVELVRQANGVPTGMRAPNEPSIGLDLADAHPTREPVEITAEVHPDGYSTDPDVDLSFALRRHGPGGVVVRSGHLVSDDGERWSAVVGDLEEDDYWLTVSDMGTDRAPSVSDWLVVLGDPAEQHRVTV